jgi:putative ABC transport system ATP-binding protein
MTDFSPPPLLQINGLTKSYPMGGSTLSILKGISLKIAPGEIVGIMGPSGSGKTSLLNCISGIDLPDNGTVHFQGVEVDLKSEREMTLFRRKNIGFVFQFFNLIPALTVIENVMLSFLIADPRSGSSNLPAVKEILARLGLEGRGAHYPNQLSGGEMQLVSIARALVHSPALILADEPTGNVNPALGHSIMDNLRSVAQDRNTAMILVTHSAVHASWADRICFLKDGVLVKEMRHNGKVDDVAEIHKQLMALGI